MRFTVVTVCFNAGDKLKETIQNVLGQTCDDYEILVKDGLSRDTSLTELKAYLRKAGFFEKARSEREWEYVRPGTETAAVRILSEKDEGIYDAMNRAVQKAKGDYISFMNCGDGYFDNDVLSKTAKIMERTGNKEIYYGDAYFRRAGNVMHLPDHITPSQCYRHVPNHQACFFQRELWRSKQLNPKYRIRADYEFFLYHYFVNHVDPVCLGIVVADYEGGGFSETKENRRRDRYEHKTVTEQYMTKGQIAKEKVFGIVTLQPVRRWIASDSPFSKTYDRIRKRMYR